VSNTISFNAFFLYVCVLIIFFGAVIASLSIAQGLMSATIACAVWGPTLDSWYTHAHVFLFCFVFMM